MSPVDQALPTGEPVASNTDREQAAQQSEPASYTSQSPNVQSRDSMDSTVYQEFYDSENGTQEAIGASKKQTTMQDPPVPPQRSSLRASRILDTLAISKPDAEPTTIAHTTPHDVYLSSEEEPSSSADDFSDYDGDVELYDSSSEESQEPSVRRKSHEVTARVVSVIFSGRPSIIDVSTSRRSISPNSIDARRSIEPASPEVRPRTSIASTPETASSPRPATSGASVPPSEPLPLRSSSMMLPPVLIQSRPAFLNNDPFPNHGGYEYKRTSTTMEEITRPKAHNTVLKSVTRSLSIVKKKSRPLLNSMGAGSSTPVAFHENLSSPSTRSLILERSLTPQNHEMAHTAPPSPPMSDEFVLHSEPVSRQDPSAYAQPHPPPPPPPRTPVGGSMKGKLLAMARRRSIHIRAAAARM